MPLATLCPRCAHRWTLNEAVSVSWFCPRCQSGRSGGHRWLCACGHTYDQHETMRDVENSLEAAMIRGRDATVETIERLPKRARKPNPPLGRCTECTCRSYEKPVERA